MDDEKTVLKVAELWLNQDYSAFDIGQELSLSPVRVEVAIRIIDGIAAVVKKRTMERIREALELP